MWLRFGFQYKCLYTVYHIEANIQINTHATIVFVIKSKLIEVFFSSTLNSSKPWHISTRYQPFVKHYKYIHDVTMHVNVYIWTIYDDHYIDTIHYDASNECRTIFVSSSHAFVNFSLISVLDIDLLVEIKKNDFNVYNLISTKLSMF